MMRIGLKGERKNSLKNLIYFLVIGKNIGEHCRRKFQGVTSFREVSFLFFDVSRVI
jgi:hypothetical protein